MSKLRESVRRDIHYLGLRLTSAQSVHALMRINDELHRLTAELESYKESLHYADGVADLAMKHRDAAEAELEKVKAERDGLRDGWFLSNRCINEIVQKSLARTIRLCNSGHMADLHIRVNGEWKVEEADWVKYLQPTEAKPHD